MPSSSEGEASQEWEARDAQRRARRSRYPEHVDRWAVIVGISKYHHEKWNLDYARADAEALYELIQQPSHGDFPREHIKFLPDKKATTRNILIALRSFLQKARKEDLVLIYFACHGAPDPNRIDNFYLLTHDTEPDAIAGTALPMYEISLSLERNLRAERGVILVDACHSAALGIRGEEQTAEALNQYLRSLSQSRKGLAWLTSAEANEVSREGAEWGGGHGVFTHYLEEGLRGAADTRPQDGIVTVGELFEYVRDKVVEATGDQQHPAPGPTPFDRELPMAIIGGLQAREHHQLGCHLYELGWTLDDRGRFASAARQFSEAVRLGRHFPQAYLELGRSHLALGEPERAVRALQRALKQDGSLTEAHFHLGIAYAELGDAEEAVQAFQSFLDHHPDDDRARWVEAFRDALAQPPGDRYALLIGIGNYDRWGRVPHLYGPVNDVALMREILVDKYAFPVENIRTLLNFDARRAPVLEAFHSLAREVTADDMVVIFYSAWALYEQRKGASVDLYLTYDTQQGSWDGAISGQEMHNLIWRIPGRCKTAIFDSGGTQLLALAEQEDDYTLFMAAGPGQTTWEAPHEEAGGRWLGLFTYAFSEQLRASDPRTATVGQVFHAVEEGFELEGAGAQRKGVAGPDKPGGGETGGQAPSTADRWQTPRLAGPKQRVLFTGERPYLTYWDLSQRRNFATLTLDDIQNQYDSLDPELAALVPGIYGSYGRAFLEKLAHEHALEALQAAAQGGSGAQGDTFALGLAQLSTDRYEEALVTFQRYTEAVPARSELMQEVLDLIAQFPLDRRHALLVGIDAYQASELPRPRGAANDARALQQVLVENCGFEEGHIQLLVNGEATREAILSAFGELVEVARETPALFYFAGVGSLTSDGQLTLVSVNGRLDATSDIELGELARLVGDIPTNLLAVIDVDWALRDPLLAELFAEVIATGWTGIRQAVSSALQPVRIGRESVYQASIGEAFSDDRGQWVDGATKPTGGVEGKVPAPEGDGQSRYQGKLTRALTRSLQEDGCEALTCAQLTQALGDKLDLEVRFVLAENMGDRVFANNVRLDRVQDLLQRRIGQQPVRQAIQILRRLIEQRNGIDPEGHVNLGLAYAALGEHELALAALKNAIDQLKGQDGFGAHYHRGRILLESNGEPSDAVSELREAAKEQPGDPLGGYYRKRANYYLGQALRAQAERDILAEAERAFAAYLHQGAPLGHREEVRSFLRARKEQGQTR